MKQFYFTLLFLSLNLFVSAQENEGKPAKDVTIIKSVNDIIQTKSINSTAKASFTAKNLTTATITAPTGSSSEIGITEGQLTVSLNGAANYSIPISVPPGINGVEPTISIDYNSQRGLKGTAANGWDIGGISTITKIPSTKFHDGVIDPVNNDSSDRFALDGQRLIIKSHNALVKVYETEYFSNLKITSYTMTSSGPEYFTVEYPDGSKAFYGISEQSRTPTDWSISFWQNPQGARISYTYTKANNSSYIASIKYGSLTDSTPINEVQFFYGPMSRIESGYFAGTELKIRDKILTEIKVIGSGLGFRNYVIGSTDNKIKSITEKSGDNTKSYNPTLFDYAKNNSTINYLSVPKTLDVGNIDSRNAATVTGDFDDDGKMDFLLYPTSGPDAKKKYWLYTDIASGMNLSTAHNVGAFEDVFSTKWLSWNNKVMPQGWTVVTKSMANATSPTDYKFTVYSTGITYPIYEQYSKVVQFPHDMINSTCWFEGSCAKTTTYKVFDKKIISGDFNGDGLTDVIAINKNTIKETCKTVSALRGTCEQITETVTSKKVYFIDLKRDLTTNYFFEAGELVTNLTDYSKVEVADFNGDGKSDLFVFDNKSVRIYTLSPTNTLVLLHEIKGDTSLSMTMPVYMGDYNGDNKSDFVIPSAYNNSLWYKYTSTGNVLVKEGRIFKPTLNTNTPYNTYDFVASDYNNDGLTDLIYIQSSRNTQNTLGFVNVGCYANVNGDITATAAWANSGEVSDINIYALPIYLPQSTKNIYNAVNQVSSTLEVAFVNKNKLHFFLQGMILEKAIFSLKLQMGTVFRRLSIMYP